MEPNDIINGRYKLIEPIGSGSFGQVWLAEDMELGIRLAVKVYIALDSHGLEEFKTEFKNTRSLNHPHLLRADHYDVAGNHPYLVMNYCPDSLGNRLGALDEDGMWKFIAEVASGLSYLHELDIVHRDIKPDNVLVNEQGDYVVSDFGLSKKMRSTLRRASARNVGGKIDSSGTLGYMAPEMFSARPEAVKATDVWALGATIYEVATGDLPFLGQGGVMELGGAEIPNLPESFSNDLNSLMRRCLARNTADRPDAQEILKTASAHTHSASHTVIGSGTDASQSNATQCITAPTANAFNGTVYPSTGTPDATILDNGGSQQPPLPPIPPTSAPVPAEAEQTSAAEPQQPAPAQEQQPAAQNVVVVKKGGAYKILFYIFVPLLLVFSIFLIIGMVGLSDDVEYYQNKSYRLQSTISDIRSAINSTPSTESFQAWQSTNHSHSSSSNKTYSFNASKGDVFSLNYSVDCEQSYDKLRISATVDGVDKGTLETITGQGRSGNFSYEIPATGHVVITCTYSKDSSIDRGRDNASVSHVQLKHSQLGEVSRIVENSY